MAVRRVGEEGIQELFLIVVGLGTAGKGRNRKIVFSPPGLSVCRSLFQWTPIPDECAGPLPSGRFGRNLAVDIGSEWR